MTAVPSVARPVWKTNFMQHHLFHHSYIAQERARERAESVRSFLLAALVVGMFFAGCVIGYFLH